MRSLSFFTIISLYEMHRGVADVIKTGRNDIEFCGILDPHFTASWYWSNSVLSWLLKLLLQREKLW